MALFQIDRIEFNGASGKRRPNLWLSFHGTVLWHSRLQEFEKAIAAELCRKPAATAPAHENGRPVRSYSGPSTLIRIPVAGWLVVELAQ